MAVPSRSNARKVIAVNGSVIGPAEARLRTVRERKLGDYAHLPKVYRDVAQKLSSPVLMGPPICDEVIALVQHLFTEKEAGAVRHLGLARSMLAAQVARVATPGRSVQNGAASARTCRIAARQLLTPVLNLFRHAGRQRSFARNQPGGTVPSEVVPCPLKQD
jgi:hypothetical protein